MSRFSEDETAAILQAPFGSFLDGVRQSLRSVTSQSNALLGAGPTQTEEASDDLKDSISSLILTLAGHPVAKKLKSRDLHRPVNRELAFVYSRLGDEGSELDLKSFLSLTSLVIQCAADLEIWKAVVDLLSSLSQVTPPSSIPASFGATPRTFTSASQQGSEQTKNLLEPHLREELRNSCYVKVGGFLEKYFQNKTWSAASDKIVAAVGACLDFPLTPTEEAVWNWLRGFQEQYLNGDQVRSVYYTTTSKKDMTGLVAERQLDLLMKSREAPSAGQNDWADVRLVGELRQSMNKAGKFLQLARYVRDVFSAQPTRFFVHGFLLCGTSMELHVFNRSGAYSMEEFDVVAKPAQFVRILTGYAMMTDKELGMDDFVQRSGKTNLLTLTDDDEQQQQQHQLEVDSTPIDVQPAIVSRATCCYRTSDGKAVVKLAWQSEKKVTEAEHLKAARDVKGVARLIASGLITTTEKLRADLELNRKRTFHSRQERKGSSLTQSQGASQSGRKSSQESKRKPSVSEGPPRKKSRSSNQATRLRQEYHASQDTEENIDRPFSELHELHEDTYRDRNYTWLAVEPVGRPLSNFHSAVELLRSLRDAIKAHQSLFEDKSILHRDISKGNIIITDPAKADGRSGMLIDLELSTQIRPDGTNEGTGAHQMTGTLAYMAIEVLESANRDIQHTYRHDLESFFYVFLSMCVNHGWPNNKPPRVNSLQAWYRLPYKSIVFIKTGQMFQPNFERLILAEFSPTFECVKDLARNLRNILFLTDKLYTGTPVNHSPLYKSMIDAFDEAISRLSQ